eukprot:COSAG02_NODE_207_length_29119_cov_41.071365_31_plen_109_part_00
MFGASCVAPLITVRADLHSHMRSTLIEWAIGAYFTVEKWPNSFLVADRIGKTWTRLAPHKEIIPLGAPGEFDSHTCYAAPPLLHPTDPNTTLLYYSGKRRTWCSHAYA